MQPGDRQLTVTWAAPADDGAPAGATGVAITAYNLSYRETGVTDWTNEDNVWTMTGGGSLAYRITGLTNGREYEVQVQTVNEAGNGAWSATKSGTPRSGGGGGGAGGGGSSKKSSSGGGSRAPSPPPAPTRSPIIGSTPAATAKELAGDLLVIQRHDQPGVEVEVGVGWISRDGQRIIVIGFVRDGDLGPDLCRRPPRGRWPSRAPLDRARQPLGLCGALGGREHAVHLPGGSDLSDPLG